MILFKAACSAAKSSCYYPTFSSLKDIAVEVRVNVANAF